MLPLRLRSRPAASTTYTRSRYPSPLASGLEISRAASLQALALLCRAAVRICHAARRSCCQQVCLTTLSACGLDQIQPEAHRSKRKPPHFWSLLRGQFQRKVPLRPYRRACLLRGCIANIEKSFLAPAWAVLRPNCKTGQLQEAILVYAASLEPVGG